MKHTFKPASGTVEIEAATWAEFEHRLSEQMTAGRYCAIYEPRTAGNGRHWGLFQPIPAPAALPGQGETISATKS